MLYKRILLKLSGEALMGEGKFGVDIHACAWIAGRIKEVHDKGIQIGVVVGGGNIFRGVQAKEFGFARTPADHIGMLATTINGLVLQQSLAAIHCKARVMSALNTDSVVETYHWAQACQALDEGTIVIFVGGTGNPYFTTDTAAALRASEMKADILLKGTKVDGVYNKDPLKDSSAIKYEKLTYNQALSEELHVMDATAIALCRENRIPIYVFHLFQQGAMLRAACENTGGSLVTGG